MERLTWLQLSDFPWCLQHGDLEEVFYRDLAELHPLCGPWDLVVLTGSLTEGGTPAQFAWAEEALLRLWRHLEKLGSRPVLVAVPGRNDSNEPVGMTKPNRDWSDFTEIEDIFWSQADLPERRWVDASFSNFTTWWKTSRVPKPEQIQYGALPGDCAIGSPNKNLNCGIFSLNTNYHYILNKKIPSLSTESWVDINHLKLININSDRCQSHRIRILVTSDVSDDNSYHAKELHREIPFTIQTGRGRPYNSVHINFYIRNCLTSPPFLIGNNLNHHNETKWGYSTGRVEDQALAIHFRHWKRKFHFLTGKAWKPIAPNLRRDGLLPDFGSEPEVLASLAPAAAAIPPPSPPTPRTAFDQLDQAPSPVEKLRLAALILGLDPQPGESADLLPVLLPPLGLSLTSRDTVLTLLPQKGEPLSRIYERLRQTGHLNRGLPPLVLSLHQAPRPMPGMTVLGREDLAALADSDEPELLLARLLWQRSSLDSLSPYRPSGAVADPHMFFGRHTEMQQLLALRERHALLIIGPRKVGKSSLLKRASEALREQGRKAVYVSIRQSITMPGELIEELAEAAQLPFVGIFEGLDYRRQVNQLGRFLRKNLRGYTLLLDEADIFLNQDQRNGGAAMEELRTLVQEGTCALALAGYGTLYRSTLSQAEASYNLGQPLYLGALEPAWARQLAMDPMERMGLRWEDDALAQELVDAVGCYPHLVQEACARLLTRLRGSRAPVLNQGDLQAVLGTWKPPNASGTLRDMLVEHAETNLSGAAQAAIWLLAERSAFSLEELDQVLRDNGFTDLDTGQLGEVAQALRVSGVCEADGDRYRFAIPLLKSAVADLNIRHRVERLAIDWRSKTPASKARFDFWGGNGNRG